MSARSSRWHTPPQATLAILSLLLLLAAASVGATAPSSSSSKRAFCLTSRSGELAELASCGHQGSISYCLSHPTTHRAGGGLSQAFGYGAAPVEPADLEHCFVDAGCTAREAAVEAEWALRRCDELGDEPSMADLRRRRHHHQQQQQQHPARGAAAVTPAPRALVLGARQPQAPPGGTAPAPAGTAAAAAATTQQTGCHTTRTTSTTICPLQTTGPESGKKLPCFPTDVAYSVCMEGYLCQADRQGVSTCLKLDNRVPPAGVAVGVFFAVAAAATAAAICFCCCRERREHRRIRRAAEAAAIARDAHNAAAARKNGSGGGGGGGVAVQVTGVPDADNDDRRPLMAQQLQQQGHHHQHQPAVQYDPFADPQTHNSYHQQQQQHPTQRY